MAKKTIFRRDVNDFLMNLLDNVREQTRLIWKLNNRATWLRLRNKRILTLLPKPIFSSEMFNRRDDIHTIAWILTHLCMSWEDLPIHGPKSIKQGIKVFHLSFLGGFFYLRENNVLFPLKETIGRHTKKDTSKFQAKRKRPSLVFYSEKLVNGLPNNMYLCW